MLIRMDISNFALIDQAVFEPGDGFTIITGETGAGKSLLIDAISALRGSRISKDAVRTGCKKAVIEAVFDQVSTFISNEELETLGIDLSEDDTLILSREILADGKSIARVNGKLVPISTLKSFGLQLVDVHGQNDQQMIFQPARHLELLDLFGGETVSDAIFTYSKTLTQYKECIEEINFLGSDPAARQRQTELLKYQIEELETADFKSGEEETLVAQKHILVNQDRIREGVTVVNAALDSNEDDSALSQLTQALTSLTYAAGLAPELQAAADRLQSILYDLESVTEDITLYADVSQQTTMNLSVIEDRLDQLFRFKVKYGSTIDQMQQFLEKAIVEYTKLTQSEKRLDELHRLRISLEKILLEQADKVHQERTLCANRLSDNIRRELAQLGMVGASFSVAFTKRPRERFFSRTGYDEVAFMMSANPGEPEKPLAKVASGGEASRIMLAIKTILALADNTPTLIFDEIDSGISGQTATVVAQKLKHLSSSHQVLCVTHMAQIAATADQHFMIQKTVENSRTHTIILELDRLDRVGEVARLLSGDTTDTASLGLAQRLIDNSYKIEN